jgi:hypothetical protein
VAVDCVTDVSDILTAEFKRVRDEIAKCVR